MPKTNKTEFYIYALVDPRDNAIRYIGKTVNPVNRLGTHICFARKGEHTYRAHWILGLLNNDLRPTLTILESGLTVENVDDRERFWIAKGKDENWPLTNMTDGGDGWMEAGSEAAHKISAANKGKAKPPITDEHRQNLSLAHKGKRLTAEQIAKRSETVRSKHREGYKRPPMTAEARQKISEGNRGRVQSPEEIELRAATARGKQHPEEWRRNISEGLKKRHYVHPPEVIEKIAASRRGKPRSDETKAKLSAAKKGKPNHSQSAETRAKISATKKERHKKLTGDNPPKE